MVQIIPDLLSLAIESFHGIIEGQNPRPRIFIDMSFPKQILISNPNSHNKSSFKYPQSAKF
jgi:hypothetical protein